MNGLWSDATDAPPFTLLLALMPAAIPQIVQSVLFLLLMVIVLPVPRAAVLKIFRALFYAVVVFFKICDAACDWLWNRWNQASTSLAVFLARNLIGGLLARVFVCLLLLCLFVGVAALSSE
ncbi:hypothetical protein MRX96_055161 [Rhipicephalus microplus]